MTYLDTPPSEIAARVERSLRDINSDLISTDLVYSPLGPNSYYRDFLLKESGHASIEALTRLERHAEQIDRVNRGRNERAWRQKAAATEYRVTPDRTDGYGGYFSPPAWLNHLFATANRPGRVLAGLMPCFDLPVGVSSVNLPIIDTGNVTQGATDDTAIASQDITDSSTSSNVAPLSGQTDVALQTLEQSPPGAHFDWAMFMDLSEAYDDDLEAQLLYGAGVGLSELVGVTNVPGIVSKTYTDASPTGSELWPYLAQTAAQVGDGRYRPPECWLMRTARWFWLQGSEDTATRPFGLSSQFYLGSDPNTPDPIGGLIGLPVFLDDAIPQLRTGADQDEIIALRPRDLILFEGEPQNLVAREPGSGSLTVRLQMHCNVAALTGRCSAGIGVLSGSGLAVQAGY